jgi:hypothetical protein
MQTQFVFLSIVNEDKLAGPHASGCLHLQPLLHLYTDLQLRSCKVAMLSFSACVPSSPS